MVHCCWKIEGVVEVAGEERGVSREIFSRGRLIKVQERVRELAQAVW